MGYGDTITLTGIVERCIYEPEELRFKLKGRPNAIYFPKGLAPPLQQGHYVSIQAREIREDEKRILEVYSMTARESERGRELFMYSGFKSPARKENF